MTKQSDKDQYMPDTPGSHKGGSARHQPGNINSQDPDSMPRGEDDDATKKTSPEFNDPPGAPWSPNRRG